MRRSAIWLTALGFLTSNAPGWADGRHPIPNRHPAHPSHPSHVVPSHPQPTIPFVRHPAPPTAAPGHPLGHAPVPHTYHPAIDGAASTEHRPAPVMPLPQHLENALANPNGIAVSTRRGKVLDGEAPAATGRGSELGNGLGKNTQLGSIPASKRRGQTSGAGAALWDGSLPPLPDNTPQIVGNVGSVAVGVAATVATDGNVEAGIAAGGAFKNTYDGIVGDNRPQPQIVVPPNLKQQPGNHGGNRGGASGNHAVGTSGSGNAVLYSQTTAGGKQQQLGTTQPGTPTGNIQTDSAVQTAKIGKAKTGSGNSGSGNSGGAGGAAGGGAPTGNGNQAGTPGTVQGVLPTVGAILNTLNNLGSNASPLGAAPGGARPPADDGSYPSGSYPSESYPAETGPIGESPEGTASPAPSVRAEPMIDGSSDSSSDAVPAADAQWGLRVSEVAPDGPAAKADLRIGDIIVAVAGKRTQSFEEVSAAFAAAAGPIEMVIVNGETNQLERMRIVPVNGRVGVTINPVVLK